MKKMLAVLLCLVLLLQLPVCGLAAEVVPDAEQPVLTMDTEGITGLEDFSRRLEEAYTIVKTPCGDGKVIVELVMPTEEPAMKNTGIRGDLDGNGQVSADDVVALLLYISMPDMFTIQSDGDLNKDGKINTDDAVKLLLHISMPDMFPLEGEEPEPTEPEPTVPKPTEPEPTEPQPTEPEGHQALPYTERYLYNTLTEEQKGWYRKIDTAINNLEEEVALGTNLPEDYYNIIFLYLMDHPEHFYVCNRTMMYSYGTEMGIGFYYADGTNKSGYGYGELTQTLRNGIAAKKAKFNAEVDKILAQIPTDIPDVEKEKMAYDHLLLNSYYNLSAQWDGFADDNWTAYGVMVNGMGVCESYSEAFQLLCLKMGINCTGIVGDAGGGHKWNAVELEDQWYACDITFDDPIGGDPEEAYHYYFNITTKQMEEMNHSTAGSDFPGPNCTGTKYSYKNYFEK